MLDKIENLKAQMHGHELNIYQRADALIEFNKLLKYTEELESKVKNSRLGVVSVTPALLREIAHKLKQQASWKGWEHSDFEKLVSDSLAFNQVAAYLEKRS